MTVPDVVPETVPLPHGLTAVYVPRPPEPKPRCPMDDIEDCEACKAERKARR